MHQACLLVSKIGKNNVLKGKQATRKVPLFLFTVSSAKTKVHPHTMSLIAYVFSKLHTAKDVVT